MSARKPLLICVVGPTAIGKTALAIKIAKAFSSEIISADSRQFFKELKIGTAVPSEEELASVKHHFIQNKTIFENYSVGDFEKEAIQKLDELFKKNNIAVLVGGSGLYVDAVTKGLDVFPKVEPEIRAQLNRAFENSGLSNLQKELKEVDPAYYEAVDLQNRHRLIRALEIIRSTGKPFSSFLKKQPDKRAFETHFVGLNAERALVYERINQRVDIMMEQGLLAEVTSLLPHKDLNALQTVGYRELFQFLEGKCSLEEAVFEIKKNTRRFAKRQGTWFRKNDAIRWYEYDVDVSEIISEITKKSAP